MFCTNCGAEVQPGQKFCNKCGAPVDPGAVNVGGQQTTPDGQNVAAFQPATDDRNVAAFQPAQNMAPVQAPSRELPKSWPIVLISCIGALVLIAYLIGIIYVFHLAREVAHNSQTEDGFWLDGDDFGGDFEDDFDTDDWDDAWDDWDDEFDDKFGDTDPFTGSGTDEYDPEDYLEENYEYKEYGFAEVYSYPDYMYLYGKDVIDDNTVIFNGKTIGGFCDFCDKEVLDGYHKIDRELLYELMEVHLVDPSFLSGDNTKYFEQSMMYCLLFTNEFSDLDVDIYSCSYDLAEPTRFYYDVEVDDDFDEWEVDYSRQEIYFNYGETKYQSAGDFSMFDEKSMSAWLYAVDKYFGIE